MLHRNLQEDTIKIFTKHLEDFYKKFLEDFFGLFYVSYIHVPVFYKNYDHYEDIKI